MVPPRPLTRKDETYTTRKVSRKVRYLNTKSQDLFDNFTENIKEGKVKE